MLERERRFYSEQNLAELLLAEGIDFSVGGDPAASTFPSTMDIPLELFDDTEFVSEANFLQTVPVTAFTGFFYRSWMLSGGVRSASRGFLEAGRLLRKEKLPLGIKFCGVLEANMVPSWLLKSSKK